MKDLFTKLSTVQGDNGSSRFFAGYDPKTIGQALEMAGRPAEHVSVRLGWDRGNPVALVEGKDPNAQGKEIPTGHIKSFRSFASVELKSDSQIGYEGTNDLKYHPLHDAMLMAIAEHCSRYGVSSVQYTPLPGTRTNPIVARTARWDRNTGRIYEVRKIRGNNGYAARSARQVGSYTIILVGKRTLIVASNLQETIAGNRNLPVLWKATEGSTILSPLPRISDNGMLVVTVMDRNGKCELFQLNLASYQKSAVKTIATVEPTAKATLEQQKQFVCFSPAGAQRPAAVFAQINLGEMPPTATISFEEQPKFQQLAH
jgi:hypothetical protein